MPQVAVIAPHLSPAAPRSRGARHAVELARAVARAGEGEWDVELVSIGPRADRRLLEPGLFRRELAADTRPDDPLDALSWELPDVLARADVAHVYEPLTRLGAMALVLAVQRHLPVCATQHGAGDGGGLAAEVGALELADLVVAFSRFGAGLGPSRRPVRLVPGGVDADFFVPAPASRRDRVVCLGPVAAGDGWVDALPPELRLAVVAADASDDELRRHYQHALVTVLPSASAAVDGGPPPGLVAVWPLGSMACGTPVICGAGAGLSEYVEDGVTGYLVETPEQAHLRVRELAADPARAGALGRAARERVVASCTLGAAGAELLAVYAELRR